MRHRAWTPERWLPAVVGATLGFHPIAEADTYWHLMLGRAVLRHGTRRVPEPTAFRAWSEPCVAIEWLWDVFTFAWTRAAGDAGLSLLTVLFGAGIGYLVGWSIERRAPSASRVLRCALAVIAMSAVADLLNVRPSLAFMLLLVACVELSYSYVEASEPRNRIVLGVSLVALGQLWAQLHASFVLALPIFASVLAPRWRSLSARGALQLPGAIVLGLLLAWLLGPSGNAVVDLILRHSGGDAVQHIADMKPFEWASLGPFVWPLGAALCLLLALPIVAFVSGAKLDPAAILLALLGAALTWTARRFAVAWVLLLVPLAAASLPALGGVQAANAARFRAIETALALLALCLWGWAYQRSDLSNGPMLHTGTRIGAFPAGAARYLASRPAGTNVLTDYSAGGPLGYWLDGHVRTFVDGRTPMYFDVTDWAVARDVMNSERALDLAIQRYAVRAAVVERDSLLCERLATRWKPVVIEPLYTTFVAAETNDAPLRGLAACGRFYLTQDSCAEAARELTHSLQRLQAMHATRFVSFLRAAAAVQCGTANAQSALTWLPPEHAASVYLPMYRWYASWINLDAGREAAALALIEAGLDADDPLAVRTLLQPSATKLSGQRMRALLERGLVEMDDNAPAALRARLALICSAQADAECARNQGLRAYLQGAREARPAVQWAAEHHPAARVRADLRAWLAVSN